jgi:hypothetical protein
MIFNEIANEPSLKSDNVFNTKIETNTSECLFKDEIFEIECQSNIKDMTGVLDRSEKVNNPPKDIIKLRRREHYAINYPVESSLSTNVPTPDVLLPINDGNGNDSLNNSSSLTSPRKLTRKHHRTTASEIRKPEISIPSLDISSSNKNSKSNNSIDKSLKMTTNELNPTAEIKNSKSNSKISSAAEKRTRYKNKDSFIYNKFANDDFI